MSGADHRARGAGGPAALLPAHRVQPWLPGRGDYRGLRRSWARDLVAGVTVGIVALPLALAFGVATGVGAAPGLVTAVVAGAVAAVFGGSHLQVSGPTGAMTVVLVPLVAAARPVGGLPGRGARRRRSCSAAALLRLGRLLAYVPWPLVEGFTVGIAVVIAAQQVPERAGRAQAAGGERRRRRGRRRLGRFAQHPRVGRARAVRAGRAADRRCCPGCTAPCRRACSPSWP